MTARFVFSGVDSEIMYADLVEPGHGLAARYLKALRRRTLSVGATATAVKCLDHLDCWSNLDTARKAAREAPTAGRLMLEARVASARGRRVLARSAYEQSRAAAVRVGDLDALADAEDGLAGRLDPPLWSGTTAQRRFRDDFIDARAIARTDPQKAIAELHRTRRHALRRNGRWTAATCLLNLVIISSDASDPRMSVRFARALVRERPASHAYVALGYCQERAGQRRAAAASYSEALRRAYVEGDIHLAQHSCAGLERAGRTKVELDPRWNEVVARFSRHDHEDWSKTPWSVKVAMGILRIRN